MPDLSSSTEAPGVRRTASEGRRLNILPSTFEETITRCFFVVILAMACMMPMQNDSWWHLRAGLEMWSRQSILLSDQFSFTVAGAPWPNHEWLSEVVFYAVYRLAGLPGLTLFAALLVTSALALAWQLMAGASHHRLLFMGLAMASIGPVWTVRPHVFTLVLLLTVVHLALRERYWPIPLLFVLWANLHGGVALGIVALGGLIAGRFYVSGTSGVRRLLLVTATSFLATWVTPLGPSLWWRIPESIHRSAVNRIVEWTPPSLVEPAHLAFWVAAGLLVATTWSCRRTIHTNQHVALVAIALVMLPLALRSRRNVPPFLLLALPALSHNVAHWLTGWTGRRRQDNRRLNAAFFVASVVICGVIVAAAWLRPAPRLKWQPIPPVVASAAEACGDRVYNTYPDGGYLIWFAPRVRVFIDSRQDPYPLPFVAEYIRLEQTGDYHAVFERYEIRCAVLPAASRVAGRLRSDGWQVRAQSEGWLVLAAGSRS